MEIAEVLQPGGIDPSGGKGAEAHGTAPKDPFRCRHRWALVSKAAIRTKMGSSIGTLFIQNCRRCGTFRASAFEWDFSQNKKIRVIWRVEYLKTMEGLQTMVMDFNE